MGASESSLDEVEGEVTALPAGTLTVFGDEYVVPQGKPAFLHLKSDFLDWTGRDFDIVNMSDKKCVFRSKGHVTSLFNEKRTIYNAAGEPLFYMKEKYMQLGDAQSVYSAKDKRRLLKVSSNFTNTRQETEGLVDVRGKYIQLVGKMTFFSLKGTIWLGAYGKGKCIAKVMSPVQLQNFAHRDWARDDYLLQIAPGVDAAVVLAMVLAYEQMEHSWDDSR